MKSLPLASGLLVAGMLAWHASTPTAPPGPDLPVASQPSCKPSAPIHIRVEPRPGIAPGQFEIAYALRTGVAAELLSPEIVLRGGAVLVSHEPPSSGPIDVEDERAGRLLVWMPLDAQSRGAGVELVARIALPEAESPGGFAIQSASVDLGWRAPSAPLDLVSVRSGAQLSLDVPAARY